MNTDLSLFGNLSLDEKDRALVVQNLTELRDSVWGTMSANTR